MLPRLAHEHVREHVGQVADHGHLTVVLLGVHGDRAGADVAQEAVQQLVRVGVDVRPGNRHEVRGAVVERRAGVGDAGGLRTAEGVTADAAPLLLGRERPHERPLGAPDVGGPRRAAGPRERRPHVPGHEPDGRADEDQVGACAGLLEARAGGRDRAALECEVERRLRLAETAHFADAGVLARGQAERPSHEADADEGDGADVRLGHHLRPALPVRRARYDHHHAHEGITSRPAERRPRARRACPGRTRSPRVYPR